MRKNNFLNAAKGLLFLGVIVLALLVRKKNYAEIPIPGQSVDEYSYSWVGLSLIENGMPVGISGIDGYEHSLPRYVNVDRFFQTVSTGDPLTINYPWMDHPPLLGLITGAYAYMSGVRVFEDTTSYIIRKPIIIISSISVALLMVFCWLNFGFLTSLLAGLIYATTPLVVLSGRMIQAENAIIPSLLLCMTCISLYIKRKKDFWLFAAAVVAGVATLFKLTGFVCHLFVLFALFGRFKEDKSLFWRDFGFFLAISLPISFLFVIYGSVYGLDNFKNILFSNYNRFYGIGPNFLIELIRNQRLTQHKFLPEVAIISGWLVFLGSMFKRSKNLGLRLTTWGLFSYLIVYIFFGSQPYGWYTFPFWPLLIIVLARFLAEGVVKGKNLMAVFFVSILMIGANISRLVGIFEFQPYANWWRVLVSAIFFMLVLVSFYRSQKTIIIRILLLVIMTSIIYTNLAYLKNINIDYWWQNIS